MVTRADTCNVLESAKSRPQQLVKAETGSGFALMISVHDGSPDSPSWMVYFMEHPNLKRMIWGYSHCRTPLYMCIHTYIILVAISSIEWSNPGTLLNHFFRHYKMEKKGLGVVLEGFIICSINYSFWARCTL